MSGSTKIQHYPHSLRLAVASGIAMCTDKILMYITPPENAITIETLYVHFKMTFDAGTPSADRVVSSIGIQNEVPLAVGTTPNLWRYVTLNQAADASRKVDIRLDLSGLLKKSNASYRSSFNDPADGTLTYVIVKLDDDLRLNSSVGTIDLWKIDALFTTTGIR